MPGVPQTCPSYDNDEAMAALGRVVSGACEDAEEDEEEDEDEDEAANTVEET